MRPIDCRNLYWDGRHYDLENEGIVNDILFFERQVERYGEPVLELACGTGRITIPLAEQGIQITGLDVSEPMLSHAQRKAMEKGVVVEWVKADCRDFTVDKKFNLIFFPFNSITHLPDVESLEACFSCVREHLAQNGRFIIDVFNPRFDILMRDSTRRYPVVSYSDPDGRGTITVTESNVYDAAEQMNRITWYYRVDEADEERIVSFALRMLFPQELDALLLYNGFSIEAKYGTYDETPFVSASPKQLVVCLSK